MRLWENCRTQKRNQLLYSMIARTLTRSWPRTCRPIPVDHHSPWFRHKAGLGHRPSQKFQYHGLTKSTCPERFHAKSLYLPRRHPKNCRCYYRRKRWIFETGNRDRTTRTRTGCVLLSLVQIQISLAQKEEMGQTLTDAIWGAYLAYLQRMGSSSRSISTLFQL